MPTTQLRYASGARNATERVSPVTFRSASRTAVSPPGLTVATRKTAARAGGATTGWGTAMTLPRKDDKCGGNRQRQRRGP
ncbi:hypothetical protein STANM309S_04411 [Streptomyces tanashiensis]